MISNLTEPGPCFAGLSSVFGGRRRINGQSRASRDVVPQRPVIENRSGPAPQDTGSGSRKSFFRNIARGGQGKIESSRTSTSVAPVRDNSEYPNEPIAARNENQPIQTSDENQPIQVSGENQPIQTSDEIDPAREVGQERTGLSYI